MRAGGWGRVTFAFPVSLGGGHTLPLARPSWDSVVAVYKPLHLSDLMWALPGPLLSAAIKVNSPAV